MELESSKMGSPILETRVSSPQLVERQHNASVEVITGARKPNSLKVYPGKDIHSRTWR